MKSEQNPKAQMLTGNARHAARARWLDGELLEARELISSMKAGAGRVQTRARMPAN